MKAFLLIFLLFLDYHQLLSQFSTNYSVNDGLPSNECYEVIQTKDRLIWVATDNGICSFDGYKFKTYNRSDGLQDNTVFSMQETENGDIWMMTLSGMMFILDRKKEAIKPYQYNNRIQSYWTGINNQFFYDDIQHKLFVMVKGRGIIEIDENGESCLDSLINYESIEVRKIKSDIFINYKTIFKSSENAKTIKTFQFNDTNMDVSKYRLKATNYQNFFINTGIDTYLFYFFENLFYFERGKISNHIKLPLLNDLACIDGKYYFLLSKNGTRIYKNIQDIFSDKYETVMSNLTATKIFKTPQNELLITTLQQGLFYYRQSDLLYNNRYNEVLNKNVRAIKKYNDQNLIVSFENGDIGIFNTKTNKLKIYPEKFYEVNDLEILSAQTIIIAGQNYCKTYDFETREVKLIEFGLGVGNKETMSVKDINVIEKYKKYALSNHRGFSLLSFENNKLILNEKLFNGVQRIFSSFIDNKGKTWLGDVNGFHLFYNNEIVKDTNNLTKGIRVQTINQYNDTTLIIGTKGKGVIFKFDNGSSIEASHIDLSKSLVIALNVISENDAIVCTNDGVFHITGPPSNPIIKKFTVANGLPANQIISADIMDNKLYSGSSMGLGVLDLSAQSDYSPKPNIKSITYNGIKNDNNVFSHTNNDIKIDYITINFKLGGKINYRYRLNQKNWVYTHENSVSLLNLPPNFYSFEIMSMNEDGIWSTPTITTFIIKSPIWKTPQFFFFTFASIILILYLWNKQRIRKIKNEFELNQKLKDLEFSALQAQMNPHFIFNCLNSIQTYIVTNEQQKAISYLSQFAKLIRMVLETSISKKISLQKEIDFLNNYVSLEQMRFKEKFDFILFVTPEINKETTFISPLMIQPLIENSIIHALQKVAYKGNITVLFQKENEVLKITVTDNGPGISEQSSTSDHHSVGLTNINMRLELMESKEFANKVLSKNVFDSNGKIIGSSSQIILKYDTLELSEFTS